VALTIPKCEVTLRAAREVASHLGLEERSQWSPAVMRLFVMKRGAVYC
jgi:hypothetical protein